MDRPRTLGELRRSGYQPLTTKEEMRKNLADKIQKGEELFPGIVGYEETVIPQIENAIISGQDIIFLGERGQAKTRIARSLLNLLDEEIPIVAGSEINDNPLEPISRYAVERVEAEVAPDQPMVVLRLRAVRAQPHQEVGAPRIVGDDHPAVPRRAEVLRGEEREAAVVPHRPGLAPLVRGADRLGGVLDHDEAVGLGHPHHRVHLGKKLLPPRRLAKPLEVVGCQGQLLLQTLTSRDLRLRRSVSITHRHGDGFAEFP